MVGTLLATVQQTWYCYDKIKSDPPWFPLSSSKEKVKFSLKELFKWFNVKFGLILKMTMVVRIELEKFYLLQPIVFSFPLTARAHLYVSGKAKSLIFENISSSTTSKNYLYNFTITSLNMELNCDRPHFTLNSCLLLYIFSTSMINISITQWTFITRNQFYLI